MTYRERKNKGQHQKTRKLRGHVSHGHGRVGKHRKHASGRGNAGGQHHHRIWMDKYHPGYFGKVGIRRFHYRLNPRYCPTTSISRLVRLVPKEQLEQCQGKEEVPVVNLLQHGYFKLLGTGQLRQPLIVKARSFSQGAERKIKKAGGACVLVA
uniref:60S large subunit ribosomal protein uL15 variant 2 n=1 Tax=Euglena gracilis TaxID=3039 RepID=A0A7L5NWQ3_EUGGR|nr:60S large subunit ribosomal protein uL15 variant 2 [Euglena gracilis]|eukprot:EG_transcript_34772